MTTLPLRIFRSFRAKYYEDDVLTAPAAYPESYFDQLTAHGFNAIWLRGILRNLTESEILRGIGEDVAQHQDALGTVIQRAGRHGVKVLLYLNEPLCLAGDDPFWKEHPDLRGVSHASGDWCMDPWPTLAALCTSAPEVRAWLREAARNVFRTFPELGGWFAITASEHLTHCCSHGVHLARDPGASGCPRCAGRAPLDLVAEILTELHAGTREASADAQTIAWNWSWNMFAEDPQADLIRRLPRDMTLLLDWERGGTRRLANGRENFVDEYSLAYVGPSERFMAGYNEARRHGLSVMAKLQVGTTHELATVPNLPLIDNLYRKLVKAEELGLKGLLTTWNFGNDFSLNTAAIGHFVNHPKRPSPDVFVADLTASYLPGADPEGVARAVAAFSRAMGYFPFDMSLLYWGPCNYALAYPLTLAPLTGKPMGASWMMHPRGDDLSKSMGQFTLEEVIELLTALVAEWDRGVSLYAAALNGCCTEPAARELGVARVIGHCYASARNVYRTYHLRRDRPADAEAECRGIVRDEIVHLEAVLPLLEADPRLGFHAECQGYQFTPALVREKLAGLAVASASSWRGYSSLPP